MEPFTTTLRNQLSEQLTLLKTEVTNAKPPVVQELVLASRHLEDARMRLGVAAAYAKGFDPWTNQVTAKVEVETDVETQQEATPVEAPAETVQATPEQAAPAGPTPGLAA